MRWALIGLVVSLLSPLVVLAAVVGLKTGVLSLPVAFDLLTLKVGLGLAGVGGLAGAIALAAGLMRPRQAGLIGLAAAVIAGATLWGFAQSLVQAGAAHGGGDVSTDGVETPAFAQAILTARETAGADAVAPRASASGCPIAALQTQVAPGVAGYALNKAGFTVRGMGVGRSDGTRTSDWFGLTHDAVVRIRPDRTDIRVTARDGARDRGEACRLARKALSEMTP